MANEIKKMRYFNGLFLTETEFKLDQNYHTEMRYRHNRYLHSHGIVYGLDVRRVDEHHVKVTQGMALNQISVGGEILSQEIILPEDSPPLEIKKPASGSSVYLYITRLEEETEQVSVSIDSGRKEATRLRESAVITVSEALPTNKNTINIILAKVTLNATGEIDTTSISYEDSGELLRIYAGVAGKALEMERMTFAIEGTASNLPSIEGIKIGGQNCIQVNSPVTNFSGSLTVTGTVDGRDVSVDGTNLDIHLANKSNPHGVTAAQLGVLPLSGGTLTGDLVMSGTSKVDGRDVSVDGTNLDTHLANKSNPHGVTAAQLGVLPLSGGTLTGNLVMSGTSKVDGRDVSVDGTNLDTHLANKSNPHDVSPSQIGALSASGGQINGSLIIDQSLSCGLRVISHTAGNASGIQSMVLKPSTGGGAMHSAVSAFSNVDGVFGVYAEAPYDTYSLYVGGTSYFGGDATFEGSKGGYVIDAFVNRSGQRLHTGDIVKLKGTPISHFQGKNNKIPVAEVILSDEENDSKVIGVVDCEGFPGLHSPDTRVGSDDPTFIEDGGILNVVTLGAFAHCKVDAGEAAIEVGDLLTTSVNPGYAKKATNPRIGSIIGKALEPLESGTGYIAVFVNIQ